jgi:glycosyltransferase involved in cell wall biosynthesis
VRVGVTVGSLALNDGGPSYSVPALCRALNELDVETDIVTCAVRGQSEVNDRDLVVHSIPYPSRRVRAIWGRPFRRTLLSVVQDKQLEIIHDNGVWLQTNSAALSIGRELRMPVVVSPRGMLEPWSLNQRSWKKQLAWNLFERSALQRASVLHATSHMEAASFRALGLTAPIAVIPNGVAVPAECVSELWSTRATLFPRTALFLSRIHPKKGLLGLVNAWAAVRPPGWRLVIAGPDEGGHRAEVEARVREKHLQRDVVFAGAVRGEAKRTLLRQAHLFVLPTHSENFGIVVAEALAYGLPVITTRGAPWRDLVDEACGWWTEISSAAIGAALTEATLMTNAELLQLGERGRAHVERTYSWSRCAGQMAAVYRWLARDGARPNVVQDVSS